MTPPLAMVRGLSPRNNLEIEFLRLFGAIHDEAEPRRCVLAHQLVDDAIGDDLIGDLDAQQPSRPRVERRLPQHLRHHLAETLEPRDLRVAASVGVLLQQPIAVRIVERPVRLLADVDAIERRLREEDLAARDELRQVAVEEREQQRGDVVAVRVGVGQDDDPAVAQASRGRSSCPCRSRAR